MKLNLFLFAVGSSGVMAAQVLPTEEWGKWPVTAACLFLVWWALARTIPQLNKDNNEHQHAQNKRHTECVDRLGDKFEGFTQTVVEILREQQK